ncbi:EcsC family protein [Pelomonas sp. KK5]|uniref:EcsC family protein n=1 Tax=Pelomonas sp. KK5 TaxID=1855730 RepID=UPI001302008E|nr:EcsC family protein [Pelomonas sp. KK5]
MKYEASKEEGPPGRSLSIRERVSDQLADAVLRLVGRVPASELPASEHPAQRAEAIIEAACRRAAAISASLAIPPGPWGLATVIPDLTLIWDLQARMVADIAAVYGRSASLGREHMLWCLFKHTGAQAFRDIAVRRGERWLVRKVSQLALKQASRAVGSRLAEKALGRSVARFVPLAGAVGIGLFAYRDTREVGRAAKAMCEAMGEAMVEGGAS